MLPSARSLGTPHWLVVRPIARPVSVEHLALHFRDLRLSFLDQRFQHFLAQLRCHVAAHLLHPHQYRFHTLEVVSTVSKASKRRTLWSWVTSAGEHTA